MADMTEHDYSMKMAAGIGAAANSICLQQMPTRRQMLELKKQRLQAETKIIEDAINALDAHPELEEFLNTLARANV